MPTTNTLKAHCLRVNDAISKQQAVLARTGGKSSSSSSSTAGQEWLDLRYALRDAYRSRLVFQSASGDVIEKLDVLESKYVSDTEDQLTRIMVAMAAFFNTTHVHMRHAHAVRCIDAFFTRHNILQALEASAAAVSVRELAILK